MEFEKQDRKETASQNAPAAQSVKLSDWTQTANLLTRPRLDENGRLVVDPASLFGVHRVVAVAL
jgi:hypothetical protein